MKIIKMISFGCCLPLCLGVANATTNQNAEIKACITAYQHSYFNDAMKICLPLAQQSHALPQFLVGNMYEEGLGISADHTQAVNWLKKSAALGNAAAQLKLAKIYSKDQREAKANHTIAAKYFQQAAANNVPEAQFMLAVCYLNGIGVERNLEHSQYWYNQAAKLGLPGTQALNQPLKTRNHQFEKSPGAQEYEIATSVSQDESEVYLESDLVWRQLAAQKGHPQAQFEMSQLSAKNPHRISWLKKAALNQHQQAQSQLAWVNAVGIDQPESLDEAIHWFHQACAPYANANSVANKEPTSQPLQFDQAVALLQTSVDDQDIHLALSIIDKCAFNNDTQAQLYLAKLYLEGKFVHQNKSLAAHLFEKAALKGNIEAQYTLGWMYFNGDGLPREYLQAYYWFNKANLAKTATKWNAKNMISQFERLPYT